MKPANAGLLATTQQRIHAPAALSAGLGISRRGGYSCR